MSLNIVSALQKHAKLTPHQTAFRFPDLNNKTSTAISYIELHRSACAIASELQSLGAIRNDRVLLLINPGFEYIAALFGCFYAGAVAIPAYPPRFNRPSDRIKDLVKDAQATFAFTSTNIYERLLQKIENEPLLNSLIWMCIESIDKSKARNFYPTDSSVDDLAVLQYTSGSTSTPKGVMLTHKNLIHNISLLIDHTKATSNDRMVAWLPPYHDMGLIGAILCPVFGNLEGILIPPNIFMQRPITWLQVITDYGGTISAAPNFAYDFCVRRTSEKQREELNLSSWRIALNGAERVRSKTLSLFSKTFKPFGFNSNAFTPCYGLAEATLGVCIASHDKKPTVQHFNDEKLREGCAVKTDSNNKSRSLVSCGKPLPNTDLKIVDPTTCQLAEQGKIGEIWLTSDSIGKGYWKKPEHTQEAFNAKIKLNNKKQTPYLATGDLGFLYNDELFITGRKKDLIIILGVNYYPEDIEETVETAHPRLRKRGTVAFSVNVKGEEKLVLISEIDRLRNLPSKEIMAAIRHVVSQSHHLPVHDIVLANPGQIPRTSSGKPQRRLCRKYYLSDKLKIASRLNQQEIHRSAPKPERIDEVAQAMSEVLGISNVNNDDNFFSLGGHSLLVTQIISRLETIWEVEIPIRTVFEAPTPIELAAQYESLVNGHKKRIIIPINRREKLPLTHSQERMWFLHELDPEGAAYNVSGALIIEGPLDIMLLHRAIQNLVNRHETLRTQYVKINGEPHPLITPERVMDLPFQDLSDHDNPEEIASSLGSKFAHQPFNLAEESLFRACLYRLSSTQHAIIVSLHHIISDAWSMGVILTEVLQDYEAMTTGSPLPEPIQRLQYIDFASWHRQWIETERFKVELEYWRNQLIDAPILELPQDKSVKAKTSSTGDLERLVFSAEKISFIREFALAFDATPFMVMLTAFQILLYRYTNQTDFVIGIPIANRNHRDSEHLIGTLVNTLAMRFQLNPKESFAQVLKKTREKCLEAYAHQNLPFERLVSELQLQRLSGQSPLIQVMFDYQNPPMPPSETAHIKMKPLFISRRASQFDLSLIILDAKLGYIAALEYRNELFDSATIKRLLKHYSAILESTLLDPHIPVSTIPLMSRQEQQEMLRIGTNPNQKPISGDTVVGRIAEQMQRTPTALAVRDNKRSLTYEALDLEIRNLVNRLALAGVNADSRVAICLQRTCYIPISLLSALWLGAAYVPIDPRFPADRILYMLNNAKPTVVLTDSASLAQIPELKKHNVLLVDNYNYSTNSETLPISAKPESTAYIIYTSGSTGRPKGVVIPHSALLNFIDSMRHTPGITSKDHLLSVTTISFDIAILEFFLPLISGASVTIAPVETTLDGRELIKLLNDSESTIMQATPATWRLLIESGWQGDNRLKILCGGEAISRSLANQLLERSGSVWNMYGPTETTVWSTVHHITSENDIYIGRPIDRTKIYILDDQQQLVPQNVTGEIYIGGAGVAQGYYKRPNLTAAQFIKDPFTDQKNTCIYRTGDIGRIRQDGLLECLGRSDHQVKIRGFRIELGEIETVLKHQKGVKESVVVAYKFGSGDNRLIAYYIPDKPPPTENELRDGLLHSLPDYMIPNRFIPIDSFPQTPNGKLDRKALPLPTRIEESIQRERIAPRNETEKKLAAIWADVLNISESVVSIQDNFFHFGHSLLAARLFGRIESNMGISLPLTTLFDGPTIADLAHHINNLQTNNTSSVVNHFEFIVNIKPHGSRLPLFCVHGAGGNVLNLQTLATYLHKDQPFYGIQSRGVDGLANPISTIEEMADAYLKEILTIQPRGPYYLSGYCGGGIVAYEMARRLTEKGEKVAFILLIDAYRPGIKIEMFSFKERMLQTIAKGPAYTLKKSYDGIHRRVDEKSRNSRIKKTLKEKRIIPHELRTDWLMQSFLDAVQRYKLEPYSGKITLFRATDVPDYYKVIEPNLGWDNYGKEGVDVHDVPGDHHNLTEEPYVRMFAMELNKCLSSAHSQ